MHIYGIWKNGTGEPIYRAAIERQTQSIDLWTQWRTQRVEGIQTVALKPIHYHMLHRQLVGMCCMMPGAQSWCSLPTQRAGMKGKVGGSFERQWAYAYQWLIHGDVWQKPTEHCKAINFQLKISKLNKNHTFMRYDNQNQIVSLVCS